MLALILRFRLFLSFALTLFISLWLINMEPGGRFAVARALQVTLLSPAQFLVNKINRFHNIFGENRRLLALDTRLTAENGILRETARENQQLRNLIGYRATSPFALIAAEVIASKRDILSRNLVVGAGTRDGARKDMPVIVLEGVVGKVIEAYPFHANVQLISDPFARTGALFSRINVPGILECRDGNIPTIQVYLHHNIQPGDSVVTSGLGGLYPKGLYIGRVSRVLPGDELFKTAEITLHSGFDNIANTFIMNMPTNWKPFTGREP
ncbi:MAG: rod shape-determining protein MreC [Fibrobacterota bacterium]